MARNNDEKSFVLEQLSILLEAGMDVSTALLSLEEEVSQKDLKQKIAKVRDRVDSGDQLWQAFRGTNIIPEQFLSFIRTGEQSGKLKEQLSMVAAQYARDKEFKSKVVAASIYPAFILAMVIVLGGVNAFVILPKISETFSKLGGELPAITLFLLAAGTFLQKYGYIVAPLFFLFVALVIFLLFINKRTKHWGQELLFRLPGIKDIFRQIEIARFGFLLGLLSNSGIVITDGLNFLRDYTTTRRYQKFYEFLAHGVENGVTFSALFSEYKKTDRLFPRSVQNLVSSAEKSGHLPEIFNKIGDIYQKKMDLSTQTLSAVIEPLLIVVVWFFVLLVALAVIFPLYNIVGNLNIY
ncbi:MAG: type II secretion system F family protein [Patescibacteria group bacterium]